MIVTALLFHLVIMPTSGSQDRSLLRPFDTGKTFATEEECQADAAANLPAYLTAHGLSETATANVACTVN